MGKNRDNERTFKYLRESEERFIKFLKKCQSLSLGTQNYINDSVEVFANATGRLEGILFFELVKERILENDMTYEELAKKIDKLHKNLQLKPGQHIYNESHLRVTIKRRNYKSIVVNDLKKVLHINDKNIKKDFLRRGDNNIDYLRFAFISLDKVTQENFIELAEKLWYTEGHIGTINNDEENNKGMVDSKRLEKMYRDALFMNAEEYKEYKEQEQYLEYMEDN